MPWDLRKSIVCALFELKTLELAEVSQDMLVFVFDAEWTEGRACVDEPDMIARYKTLENLGHAVPRE